MTLCDEIREGYKISSQMKKVWSIQLSLLKKVLEVCEKYDLKIWAEGGTLLGTIRHKGYIPWDDDIDLVMFRDDYDKLNEIASKEFKYPYFLQSSKTEKKFHRGHIQVRMSNTAAILPNDIMQNFNQGIFIDIFVLDAIPNDLRLYENNMKEVYKIKHQLHSCLYDTLLTKSPKIFIKNLINKIKISYSFNKKNLQMENLLRQYSISDNSKVSLLSFINLPKYERDKYWYASTVYMDFENIKMPVPIGWNDILKVQFGENYMKPVQIASMHGEVIFDTDHSYLELLPKLRKMYILGRWKRFLNIK